MGHAFADRRADIQTRMERMYRPQRLIYDLTRKYYLIGRDQALREVDAKPGSTIIDIGCGTGRNLVRLAKLYPSSKLFGIDAAAVTLETTAKAFAKNGLNSLSIMDHPSKALENAIGSLAPGRTIHIVDFGPMTGLPKVVRNGMTAWLSRFGVHYRPEIGEFLSKWPIASGSAIADRLLLGGYAQMIRFEKAA